MAVLAGNYVGGGLFAGDSAKGRYVVFNGAYANSSPPDPTYYKMQASCPSAPSGFISWVNTTGDDTDKPACPGASTGKRVISWRR